MIELNIIEETSKNKERILLLNPLGSDSLSAWKNIIPFIKDYEICLCDYPGYRNIPYKPYDTLKELSDEIIKELYKLPNKPLHIIGFSFGSWLAQHIVLSNSSLNISTLTLIGSSAKIYPHGQEMMKSWTNIYKNSGLIEVINQFALWSFYTPTFEYIPDLMNLYSQKTIESINHDEAILNQMHVGNKFVTPLNLEDINVPCLIIRGEHDFFYPKFASEILASRIPNSKLVEIKNAAHAVVTENGKKVLEKLLEFLPLNK